MKPIKILLPILMVFLFISGCYSDAPETYQLQNNSGSYTIEAPGGWEVIDNGEITNMVNRKDNVSIISVYSAEAANDTFEEYGQALMESFNQALISRGIIDGITSKTTNGHLEFSFVDNQNTYWYLWTEKLDEDHFFYVSFSTTAAEKDNYGEEVLRPIIDSFQVVE
ncbi:hypothetical protein [Culicoidibacter larvae]|uniref:PsbP C-terminal domain-containing protein n=1 Tax=Culicoidibacter larvae TaxID=2579976 RepID=A0A5R8QAV4_9FIRM|nr:hypothetical protein [Culicoidibacter larvae]TLG72987.1 hypothetical protein FEZ08_08045 [Culicoidibacter larvae]